MATEPRALNIDAEQCLVHFDNAEPLPWHHRILLRRLRRSSWIICTPDGDMYAEALSEHHVRPLRRHAPFPRDIASVVYAFDPDDLSTTQLMA